MSQTSTQKMDNSKPSLEQLHTLDQIRDVFSIGKITESHIRLSPNGGSPLYSVTNKTYVGLFIDRFLKHDLQKIGVYIASVRAVADNTITMHFFEGDN